MVEVILMYFSYYLIDNIPRDNNRYTNAMVSVSSLTPINIEDEKIIPTIKNIGRPYHKCDIQSFIKGNYFSTTYINACELYQDVFNYLKNSVVPTSFDHNSII